MFRFAHENVLWLMASLPLMVAMVIWYFAWQKKARKRWAETGIFQQMAPNTGMGKPILKTLILLLATAALIIGAAQPQFGSKLEEVKQEGVDIIVALDVSNSMLAEDLPPNRLESAKRSITRLVEQLHTDRIGIIVFAGDAYVQLPITTDYAAAKMFLNTINTDIVPTQGTAIGAAIELAIKSFDEKSPASKSIIILTDGENHEDDAIGAAQKAQDQSIVVHTVGMGSEDGVPIPVYRGRQQIGYRKDKSGSTVVTKLNEMMLQDIASAGGGLYARASRAGIGLKQILDEVSQMDKAEVGMKVYTDYDEQFQYLLAIALVLLVLDSFITERKSQWFKNLNLFKAKE